MDHDLTSPEVATAPSQDEGLPSTFRRDGWTPFARRLFLEVLAETGRVSLACEYCGLSKQSAYALRARDPVFATSWDAACEIARAPLADALYEKAIDGVTDTITRDGEVVATRHRFDSRLSIAVLHRLDKRCDRAAETGAHHLALGAPLGRMVGPRRQGRGAGRGRPPQNRAAQSTWSTSREGTSTNAAEFRPVRELLER
jgi:hypothetical protein